MEYVCVCCIDTTCWSLVSQPFAARSPSPPLCFLWRGGDERARDLCSSGPFPSGPWTTEIGRRSIPVDIIHHICNARTRRNEQEKERWEERGKLWCGKRKAEGGRGSLRRRKGRGYKKLSPGLLAGAIGACPHLPSASRFLFSSFSFLCVFVCVFISSSVLGVSSFSFIPVPSFIIISLIIVILHQQAPRLPCRYLNNHGLVLAVSSHEERKQPTGVPPGGQRGGAAKICLE